MQEMTWIEFIGSWVLLIVIVLYAHHKRFFGIGAVNLPPDLEKDVRTDGGMGVTDGEEK